MIPRVKHRDPNKPVIPKFPVDLDPLHDRFDLSSAVVEPVSVQTSHATHDIVFVVIGSGAAHSQAPQAVQVAGAVSLKSTNRGVVGSVSCLVAQRHEALQPLEFALLQQRELRESLKVQGLAGS